jgi:hypothetical protein
MKKILSIVFALTLFASTADAKMHLVYTDTSAVALSSSCAAQDVLIVKQVTIHFSAAPTTSENLVFTLDANAGAAYDTVVYTVDPSVSSMTDLVWIPDDGALVLVAGDALDITYTNTDTGTIGVTVYYEFAR